MERLICRFYQVYCEFFLWAYIVALGEVGKNSVVVVLSRARTELSLSRFLNSKVVD